MFKLSHNNYKNKLLEISARYFGVIQPEYFHFEYGPDHAKVFLCICSFQQKTTSHEGRTKVEAEQHASQEMLKILNASLIKYSYGGSLTRRDRIIILPEMTSIIETLGTDTQFEVLSLYGDAVLRYHVALYLFNQYPQFQEGILTRITSEALRIETRANIAQQLGMETCIVTEVTSRTLAQSLSSLIGKCALLHGDAFCYHFIQENYKNFIDLAVVHILKSRILDSHLVPTSCIETKIHNYKSELFEYAQKIGGVLPEYRFIEQTGEAHDPSFTISCHFRSRESIGLGKTKKSAEQEASHKMLNLLKSMDAESTRRVMPSSSSRYSAYSFTEYSPEYKWDELKSYINWHKLNNIQRLQEAFTHPSKDQSINYQRLEFLGDAILREVLLDYILKTYPGINNKTEVSEKMSQLVSAPIQAQIACQLNIESYIESQATITESILSDVLEALIAVVFLENSVTKEAASACIIAWFQNILDQFFFKKFEAKNMREITVASSCPKVIKEKATLLVVDDVISCVSSKNHFIMQTNDLIDQQKKFDAISKIETAQLLHSTQTIQQLTYAQVLKKPIPYKVKPQFFKSTKDAKALNFHDLKEFPPL